MSDPKAADDFTPKRTRAAFRALIDEMLAQLRVAGSNEKWNPETRARVEADLARIMDSVRREAVSDRKQDS